MDMYLDHSFYTEDKIVFEIDEALICEDHRGKWLAALQRSIWSKVSVYNKNKTSQETPTKQNKNKTHPKERSTSLVFTVRTRNNDHLSLLNM